MEQSSCHEYDTAAYDQNMLEIIEIIAVSLSLYQCTTACETLNELV